MHGMARRDLNPRLRNLLLQGSLVIVLAGAVGLAALVTWQVRRSMRVELAESRTVGRLVVRLPVKWVVTSGQAEKGDAIEADEPPGEQPGRRLRIARQRSDGLIPPLEHLIRTGPLKADVLRALAEGRQGYSLSNLTVAGWPGQMLTMTESPRAGVIHKDIVACAILPAGQAVVVRLEGMGPIDASDRELVRQMCENVSVTLQSGAPDAGGIVELVDEITVEAPSHYILLPNDDPNQLQRQLVFDGAWGSASVAIDLAACVFFPDDGDDALLAMLAARDPDWRSGPVKRLGNSTWSVDRTEASSNGFPARACLTAHRDGRALLVVMRGGPGDRRLFDSAWNSLAATVKFGGSKDLSGLLKNGADAVRELTATDLTMRIEESGQRTWFAWDQSENADQETWSQQKWQWARGEEPNVLSGTRTMRTLDPHSADTQFEQQWSVAADFSRYQITTQRETHRAGGFSKKTLEQSFSQDKGRFTLAYTPGPSLNDVAAPAQFVPGALLPMLLRELAEKPALLRTESFVGIDTVAPPGLLTLFVTRLTDAPLRRDERGEPMDCISVSVNGTGVVSRWYYSPQDQGLRFIDFAGGVRASSK